MATYDPRRWQQIAQEPVEPPPSYSDIPKAMLDMYAAALRGGTRATLGLPGDLESLGRMGINKLSPGAVGEETALPTTEDWDKKLPPLDPLLPMPGGKMHPYDKVGEFAPFPGAPEAAIKAASMARALRAKPPTPGPAVDTSRRAALGTMGKGAALAGATAVAPMAMVKALRAAPEAGVAARAVPVATAAAKGLTRAGTMAALTKGMNVFGTAADLSHLHPDDAIATVKKAGFKSDEELANYMDIVSKWEEPQVHGMDYEGVLDEVRAYPEFDQMSPTYGLEPDQFHSIREKHRIENPEATRYEAVQSFLDKKSPEEVRAVMVSGKIPKEWENAGVTKKHLAYHSAPIMGPMSGPPKDALGNIVNELEGLYFSPAKE